jgi:hypothetical protein
MLFAALLPRRRVTLHQHYTIKKNYLQKAVKKKDPSLVTPFHTLHLKVTMLFRLIFLI